MRADPACAKGAGKELKQNEPKLPLSNATPQTSFFAFQVLPVCGFPVLWIPQSLINEILTILDVDHTA